MAFQPLVAVDSMIRPWFVQVPERPCLLVARKMADLEVPKEEAL